MLFGRISRNSTICMKSCYGILTMSYNLPTMANVSSSQQNTGEQTMNEKIERINGWAAMIGVIAAMGSYATTGQIIPGIW